MPRCHHADGKIFTIVASISGEIRHCKQLLLPLPLCRIDGIGANGSRQTMSVVSNGDSDSGAAATRPSIVLLEERARSHRTSTSVGVSRSQNPPRLLVSSSSSRNTSLLTKKPPQLLTLCVSASCLSGAVRTDPSA